ncbi:peptide ABC transporter substrate-binding protein [Psittacicella hinzii]|nr:peptide ABC transporter substrate-binding protein [Psittacicella hinzii]
MRNINVFTWLIILISTCGIGWQNLALAKGESKNTSHQPYKVDYQTYLTLPHVSHVVEHMAISKPPTIDLNASSSKSSAYTSLGKYFEADDENTFYLPISKSLVLDPAFATDRDSLAVMQNIYETLVSFPSDEDLRFGAAVSYDISPDGKRYLFHLRQDAKWSNGEPVTAYDFVYSWQRLIDSEFGAPNRHVLINGNILNAKEISDGLKSRDQLGVAALSDYELLVVLDQPTPWLLQVLASPATAPVHAPDRDENGHAILVTNGAYKFTPDENQDFLLVKNPNYWDIKNVHINFIRSYGDKDGEQPVNYAKQNRSIIYLNQYNESSLSSLFYTQIQSRIYPESLFLEINLFDRAMNKLPVRKALNLLIDRKAIVAQTFPNAIPSTVFVPPVVAEAKMLPQNRELLNANYTNYDEAINLLAQAGYSESFPLTIDYVYPQDQSAAMQTFMEKLAAQLKENSRGIIQLNLIASNPATYFEALRRGEYQLTAITYKANYNHASSFYNMLQSQSGDNFANYDSFQYDRLLNQAARASDSANRQVLYEQASALIAQDLPIIPILWQADKVVVDKRLRNYANNSYNIYIKDMYFDNTLNASGTTLATNAQTVTQTNKGGVTFVTSVFATTPVIRPTNEVNNVSASPYATTLKKLLMGP